MAKHMNGKCTCGAGNVFSMILSVVFFAVGFWVLLNGIMAQWDGLGTPLSIMGWYAVGFLLFVVGKWFKWKSMSCPAHGMCH